MAPPFCHYSPASDTRAPRIREELIRRFGYRAQDLQSPQRVYEEAIRRAEDEFIRGPDSAWVATLRHEGVIIPWIFDDGDPFSTGDLALRQRVVTEISGTSPSRISIPSLVRSLPVVYREEGVPEEDAIAVYRRREARCTGFQYLHAGILLLAGLQPAFYEEILPGRKRHPFVGARSAENSEQPFFIDPAFSNPVQGPNRLANGTVRSVSRLEVLAAFHANQVEINFDGREAGLRRATERHHLQSALWYAPNDPSVYFNVGQWLRRDPTPSEDNDREVRICFDRVRQLDPRLGEGLP